jgi:hypothetical protein
MGKAMRASAPPPLYPAGADGNLDRHTHDERHEQGRKHPKDKWRLWVGGNGMAVRNAAR